MRVSHFGTVLKLKDGATATDSPRMLLYQSDFVEERNVVCLKRRGGDHDCTAYMKPSDVSCTSAGVGQEDRTVLPTVDVQLRAATALSVPCNTRAVRDLTKRFGVVPCVPALAAWAGVGSGARLLYKAPSCDALYVRVWFSCGVLLSDLLRVSFHVCCYTRNHFS